MQALQETGGEEYEAQRRAFHETAVNEKQSDDSQGRAVLGGRAERNRRQAKEKADTTQAADVSAKSRTSRKDDVPPEVIGTRGYQPGKAGTAKPAPRQKAESALQSESPRSEQNVNAQNRSPASVRTEQQNLPGYESAAERKPGPTSPAPQGMRTTGPIAQQPTTTTGPIAQQPTRTTGPIAPQVMRTTGPIAPQGMRTTGPIAPQGMRTTGPIAPQGMRTTGPIAPQGMRTTGPIAPQGMRTTGPIAPQGMRTTGPIAPQYTQTAGQGNVPGGYSAGHPESQGWQGSNTVPGQTAWRPANSGGYAQPQKRENIQPEGYRQTEQQNVYYAAQNNVQKPLYPNQEQSAGNGQKPQTQNQPGNAYYPPKPPEENGGRSGQTGRGLYQKIMIGIAAAVILIVGGIFLTRYLRERADYRAMEEYVHSYDALFVPGVYVDEIPLEGMNMAQAQAMVQSNAQQRSSAWGVNLTYNGQIVRTITGSDLSMNVDVQDALSAAWNQGHIGSVEERKAAMDQLQANAFHAYTADPSGDTSVIDTILQEINRQVYRVPQDATIASFNPDLSYPFTFNQEVVGRSLNIEAAKQAIFASLSEMTTTNVELQLETQQPNVTVESIKSSLLEMRGTATTPISSSSADERNANIRNAFSKISGTIIQPGGQFSFNSIVGPRTEKNGFLPAIEYAYGELSDGIGGGVCQASTTVYLAAVRAGMEIVKREPHSDAVSYIEYGKDATVYWYSNHKIDMVFRNTTSSPIYITAAVQSSPTRRTNLVCVVNIYGATLNGLSYDIVTQETVIEAPTEPEYVKDKNGEYVTYTDQQKIVRKASNGCSVDSWRVTYENGREVDRVFMYNDIYKPKAERIYVGVTPR